MNPCESLFAHIDELNAEFIPFWEQVCNIGSTTDCKAGLDRVSACFAEVAEAHGMTVFVLP